MATRAKKLETLLDLRSSTTITPLSGVRVKRCIRNFPYIESQEGINPEQPTEIDIFGIKLINEESRIEYGGCNLLVRTIVKKYCEPYSIYQLYHFSDEHQFSFARYYGQVNIFEEDKIPYKTYSVLCEHNIRAIKLTRERCGKLTKAAK